MTKEFINRIRSLITEGEALLKTSALDDMEINFGDHKVEQGDFSSWKTRCEITLSYISSLFPSYTENFKNQLRNSYRSSVRGAIGVLRAILKDNDEGLLDNWENVVLRKSYAGLLITAQQFLESKYKDPAGVLAGVALEETLKQIGRIRLSNFSETWKFGTLNQKLTDAKVYNDGIRNELNNLYQIRNHANHAEWNKFDDVQIRNMINTINKLIADYL